MVRVRDALLLLWLVTSFTFALLHLAPGDPASLLISPTATAEDAQRLRASLGLDTPLLTQYVHWLAATLQGDLGESIALALPVRHVIADALPVSLFLGMVSLLISFIVGIGVGGAQALRLTRRTDTIVTLITTALFAAPGFWVALALVAMVTSGAALLGVPAWLRLPAFGMRDPASLATGFAGWIDVGRHAIIPLLVLSVPGAAGVARYAREALLSASAEPFVRAAHARGLARFAVESRYVLRSAWPPLIVLFGLTLPGVIAGSVFVEQVFAWPGLGRVMLASIAARDYPVVLGLTLVYAGAVILSNLLADIAIDRLDPRRRP